MNSIEEYQNMLGLFKQALKFYADKNNYEVNVPQNNVLFALIEMDKGAQARFVLEKYEELEKLSKNLEEEFTKNITKAIENGDDTSKIMDMIEELKNIEKK